MPAGKAAVGEIEGTTTNTRSRKMAERLRSEMNTSGR